MDSSTVIQKSIKHAALFGIIGADEIHGLGHLGSTTALANEDGTLKTLLRYTTFGEIRAAYGNDQATDYRYTGQRSEGEIGLYYYVARFYDPALGRFIQPDSLIPDPGSSNAYDRYAYVNNNPVNFNDPSGHELLDSLGEFALGMTSEALRLGFGFMPQVQEVLEIKASESNASIAGRMTADVGAIALGVAAFMQGAATGVGGTIAACVGTACTAAIATIGVGALEAAWGASVVGVAAIGLGQNLANMTGRSSSSMLSANGPHIDSKQVWEGKQGMLHVENPEPGERPGQIHFQSGNNKWIYDPETNTFSPFNSKTPSAPNWLKDLLKQKDFQKALEKGMHYLGEN